MVTTPALPVSVTVLPEIVAGPDTTVKVMLKLDVALAVSAKGASVVSLSLIGSKVSICDNLNTSNERVTAAASPYCTLPGWVARTTTVPA